MSDYRNPNDPFRRDMGYDPDARAVNATWGWIAAAVFIVIVLAVAFGIGHQPAPGDTNVASNGATPPAAGKMAPPATMAPPSATPAPSATTPAPVTPAPNAPAQRSQ
jgi:cell division protein FtsN